MLLQVFSPLLDPKKCWYGLNHRILGSWLNKLPENVFFKLFPEELKKCRLDKLNTGNGDLPDLDQRYFGAKYLNRDVFVVSTLGLCGALLRQKEIKKDGYLLTESFKKLGTTINRHSAITGECVIRHEDDDCETLRNELKEAKENITKLKAELSSAARNPKKTCVKFSTKTSPSKSPVKSPKRKRPRLSKNSAGKILRTLEGVCERHMSSVASVLGHLCSHDAVDLPSDARDIISEVVNAVTDKKGVKRGMEIVLPDVIQMYMKEFRVPDWVLLYFKLEAHIPDDGWQTMMNLTNLGRTGVSV